MKTTYLLLILLFIGLSGCATTNKPSSSTIASPAKQTGSGVLVIKQVNFKKGAAIRDAVKNECNLDGKLTQFIEKNAISEYAQILTGTSSIPANAQVLTIEIEQVQGGGGGAWSGGKMVLINGQLTERGKTLGNFKARRFSGGGVFGGYKGTCAILGRCVKALGKDIAGWLTHPAPDSTLGDL